MGTIIAQVIVDQSASDINDVLKARWTEVNLLSYLNDGQREGARLRPDLTSTAVDQVLVAGVHQSIPADGQDLLNNQQSPMMNMGVGGGSPGPAITEVSEYDLSLFRPGWASDAASAVVKHFMKDPLRPYKFRVYPAQPSAPGNVKMVYSKVPVDILIGASITLPDEFENALRNYMNFRALTRDTEEGDQVKGAGYYKIFREELGAADG